MHAAALVSVLSAGLLAATAAAGFTGPAISDVVLRYSGSLAIAAAVPVLAAPVGFKSVLRRQPEEDEDDDGDESEDEDDQDDGSDDDEGDDNGDEDEDDGEDDGDDEDNNPETAPYAYLFRALTQ